MYHHANHRPLLAVLSAALLTLAAACSSESTTATSAAAATSAQSPVPAPTLAETPPADTAGTSPAVPPSSGDICATVPSLDVINAQLDEPVVRLERLERGLGTGLCQASGDGVANVSFTRVADSDEQQMRDLADQLGYTVTEVGDPALPGAFTYAGAVTVFIDGTEFTVQAITLDTISDPTSPAAVQRSATLLAAWLQLLGV